MLFSPPKTLEPELKNPARKTMKYWLRWQGCWDARLNRACNWLLYFEFCRSFDGCTAIIDIEFTEDALGMGAHRA